MLRAYLLRLDRGLQGLKRSTRVRVRLARSSRRRRQLPNLRVLRTELPLELPHHGRGHELA